MGVYLSKTIYVCIEAYGCCRFELENIFSSMYDHIKPWNLLLSSPSKANVLIVSGWLNLALQTHIKKVYEQLKADKRVIAIGTCQLSGSVYHTKPHQKLSIDQILPVSIFVPGCPPSPEQIISGIKLALKSEGQNTGRFLNVF